MVRNSSIRCTMDSAKRTLVLLAACNLLAACSPDRARDAESDAPNIDVARATGNVVVIVIDTLRADYVGAYGQQLDTTPFIDSMAAEGIVFENARSNSSFTRQSMSAMYSGLYPSHGGQIGHWASPPEGWTTLPQYFSAKGYRTGYVSSQFLMPDFEQYFDVGQTSPNLKEGLGHWSGAEVTERALNIAGEFGDAPFFLYAHYIDPHALYVPSKEYYERFQPNPIPEDRWAFEFYWPLDWAHSIEEGLVPGDPAFEDMKLRYAAEIAMTDDYVRSLIEGLRAQGQLDNATVLIVSDHGEEFFEHQYLGHSWTLFEESIRVPMILWSTGLQHPGRISVPVSLVDVLPSLLDLYGIDYDAKKFDGRSWFKGTGSRRVIAPKDRPQISELIYYEKTIQRSIVDGDYKFYGSSLWWDPEKRHEIDSTQGERAAALADGSAVAPSLWKLSDKHMLFHLSADPMEHNDIYAEAADRLARIEPIRRAYRERVTKADELTSRGGLADELDPDASERLKALGYIQ